MGNISDITQLISQYEEDKDFTGGVSLKEIKLSEDELSVAFSEEYKWFLEHYGSGGVLGIDILGIAKNGISTVKNTTMRLRKEYNLAPYLYVVEDCDEFFYCVNSNDSKVYYWDREEGVGEVVANDFIAFFEERVSGMKENL
ncbi:SMI1/KNR4 family protein [Listeria sp. FSL L7-1582]|uniref:SMI1/KNR4 family protein n=1 Tax=Listeria portnoyi TaxID=2713504 RepID=UPI00164E9927|nr:SMI1/KNR4 family protein [Listeria portnoyi]MBC6308206.1 SMI1/KNR4 family protein [Listeria portnoyi]